MKKPQERYSLPEFRALYNLQPARNSPRTKPPKDWAGELLTQLHQCGLPVPVREYQFHAVRKFRFDLCYPEWKLAIEIEGVVPHEKGKSRHQTVSGYSRDVEKYNLAVIDGWRLIRATPQQVKSGKALEWLEAALKSLGGIAKQG